MTNINKRLACVASFVDQGARVVDVGTDHAYLPIFLTETGVCESAIGTDIHEGPCQKARDNIALNGLSEKINIIKTDGLKGIEPYSPTNIVIAGMGGDLIWKILSQSPEYSRNAKLILSPMTKIATLRCELVAGGYEIEDEALCFDDRIYQVIVARYTGHISQLSEIQSLIGPRIMEHAKNGECKLYPDFIDLYLKKYDTICLQKQAHGISIEHEEKIMSQLKKEKEMAQNGEIN